jgi:hypothetical protein
VKHPSIISEGRGRKKNKHRKNKGRRKALKHQEHKKTTIKAKIVYFHLKSKAVLLPPCRSQGGEEV